MTGSDNDKRKRFAEVVSPHLDEAFRLARWLAGNRTDGEDILQDAALRAFQNIDQFRGQSARAWVLAIVRNTALTWLSRNRNLAKQIDEHVDDMAEAADGDSNPTPETVLFNKLEADRVRGAVADLPLVFREVLVMREFQGLSYRELASVTGLPIGTVMSRLSRARQLLLASLAEHRND